MTELNAVRLPVAVAVPVPVVVAKPVRVDVPDTLLVAEAVGEDEGLRLGASGL